MPNKGNSSCRKKLETTEGNKAMKKQRLIGVGLALSGLMLTQVVVEASITGVSIGTGAPPTTLGGWAMTAFPADGVNPVYPTSYADINSVPSPGGGSLTFSQALTHDLAGSLSTGWATWSHGYTGDVYDTIGSSDPLSVTLGLPAATRAFYFYAEPAPYSAFTISATAQDGTLISQAVLGGGGAWGFGFYTSGADVLTSIKIEGLNTDFAIGEFGISAVPEPSTVIAGALMLLPFGLRAMRCLRSRQAVSGK